MKITLSKDAKKALDSLDTKTAARIWEAFRKIPDGDIKPLTGVRGVFRLRVGSWRVIFSYTEIATDGGVETVASIKRISPRGDAYKGV